MSLLLNLCRLKSIQLASIIFVLLFFHSPIQSQEINVTFKVIDKKDEPVPFVSFKVLKRTDTLIIQKKSADSSGKAVFRLLKDNQYIVRITAMDFMPIEKGIIVTSGQPVFSFLAEPISKTLSAVEVKAQKPFMRQEDDKTIVDPENIAASSTSAFEILEKTPGLFVDQDGNVYLSSTTPATIHINGREMKMSTADIATLLKNLPPNSIKQLEILRTPSAKYDASGSGGIVNVVLKKGVKIGLTGSINSGMNQGRYGNQFIGLNINNNTDTKRSYLNLQYNRRNSYERIVTDRIFAPDSLLSQDAFTKYPGHSYYLGYGIGYQLNKKWEIDYDGRVNLNYFSNSTSNENQIKKISNGAMITSTLNKINNKGNSVSINQGLSSTYKIDTLGSVWDIDLSYNYSKNNSDQYFSAIYSIPFLYWTSGDGAIGNSRDFINFKTDLVWKLPTKITLESGVKSTWLHFKSETDYFKVSNGGVRTLDPIRTNTYRYRENINSAYIQASKTVGNFILKSGVRLENTNMKGRQANHSWRYFFYYSTL